MRLLTGLPIVKVMVRGGTGHRKDLCLKDGSIVHLYPDGTMEKSDIGWNKSGPVENCVCPSLDPSCGNGGSIKLVGGPDDGRVFISLSERRPKDLQDGEGVLVDRAAYYPTGACEPGTGHELYIYKEPKKPDDVVPANKSSRVSGSNR